MFLWRTKKNIYLVSPLIWSYDCVFYYRKLYFINDHTEKEESVQLITYLAHLELSFLFSFCRMFSYGEFKQEDQEKMLEQLNKKVEEVYRSCIGDNEANIRLVDLSISYVSVLLHA